MTIEDRCVAKILIKMFFNIRVSFKLKSFTRLLDSFLFLTFFPTTNMEFKFCNANSLWQARSVKSTSKCPEYVRRRRREGPRPGGFRVVARLTSTV